MNETFESERMVGSSVLVNLFVLAVEIQPFTTARIANLFYDGKIGNDLAEELLSAIVF